MIQSSAISLETTHNVLGWPAPDDVIHPRGAGPSVFATLVREKIGRALQRFPETRDARIGVLMADSDASTSEPPLAIVAELHSAIDAESLRELHRLSWNFSHAPTVITIEPSLIRVWSCCEAPDPERPLDDYLVQRLPVEELEITPSDDLEARAARGLHWINLVSGQFFAEHSARFNRDGRADQTLLKNLRYIRQELANQGLMDDDICHDLLARVIFVQFLFHRKDQDGNAALTAATLNRLQNDQILKNTHPSFDSVLLDYDDTYRLFDWLNGKFNGDLFPGKGDSPDERAKGWATEREAVKPKHLSLLADFIRGDLDMPSHQKCLWPQYAFDVIPLDFISSIYETFVGEHASQEGIYYTPSYLVDFILDRVLPWDGTEWDLKILDPACGSGIFLVKSFQRLVHRWKLSNPGKPVRAENLRRLLDRNIFGVDKDAHAVRVACFSLYLAMCDEIEPRHYWTQVTFPPMRHRRLVCSDFFSEDQQGFNTTDDASSYDLVVGNAPFGADVITDEARSWANSDGRNWSVPNNDVGGLFLAKAAQLSSGSGQVALVQSANTLLFNIGKASKFRTELFTAHRVEEIYNLSALRFRVFKTQRHTTKPSVAPVCIVVLRRAKSSPTDTITYVSPKHVRPSIDDFTIVIEPSDQRTLTVQEVLSHPSIWSQLMWGNARDLQLISKLQTFSSLKKEGERGVVKARQGIVFGDRKKHTTYSEGRKLFDETLFPPESLTLLDTDHLPLVTELWVHSRASTDLDAFSSPQLIIKHSWNSHRFHARLCVSGNQAGILCNQSYLSVHADLSVLEAACVSHNSKVAVYFHFLTSGRFAAYRPKLSKDEILGLPIPHPKSGLLGDIESYPTLDERAFELFGLKDAERVLIEDAVEYTLDDFLHGNRSKGRQPTCLGDVGGNDAHLRSYCSYFLRVLRAGFGNGKSASATVFRCPSGNIPYRLVAFALGGKAEGEVEVKDVQSSVLLEELDRMNKKADSTGGGIYNRRIARIYDASQGVPTVFVVKPDQKRFWTRSMGLQDGDEVAVDLFRLQQPSSEDYQATH